MGSDDAILAFSALAQPTRLAVFRLLMTHEPDGLPAGDVARQLDVPHNTMSTHLGILSRAGLIRASRHSRSIVYLVRGRKRWPRSQASSSRTAVAAGRRSARR